MRPYIALVSDQETFDPAVHSRRDLVALDIEMSGADFELPRLAVEIPNPRASLSGLAGRRVFVSDRGNLLFDGRLALIPRGGVTNRVTIEAIARPDNLDDQLAALAESIKSAPGWDPLFVPFGSKSDLEEIMAGYSSALAYSRLGGPPSIVDALTGSTALDLLPIDGSVDYNREPVAPAYGIRLTARWRQAGQQFIDLTGASALSGFSTMTPDEVAANLPKVGSSVGDGFVVAVSEASTRGLFLSDPEDLEYERPVDAEELDPAWIEAGSTIERATVTPMRIDLALDHRFEVNRTETCEFEIPVALQDGASEGEVEFEEIALRDISEAATAPLWRAGQAYATGDEVLDGSSIYACREDHTSGTTRNPLLWSLVGEAGYVANRRSASFLSTTRGQAALAHAVQRVRARARVASRCVSVSFEAPMPDPWTVTEDCTVTIAHPKIPGGTVTGRLVSYVLRWSGGQRTLSGTIAACPGTGAADTVLLGNTVANPAAASGRASVTVTGRGEEQKSAFLVGSEVPETEIEIRTTPAPSNDFEHAAVVSISGEIGIPHGVTL